MMLMLLMSTSEGPVMPLTCRVLSDIYYGPGSTVGSNSPGKGLGSREHSSRPLLEKGRENASLRRAKQTRRLSCKTSVDKAADVMRG